MYCIICGNDFNSAICPRCNYDESQNREYYPTLADDGNRLRANAVLRDAFVTSLLDQIAAMKLASDPASQAKVYRQTAQIDHTPIIRAQGICGEELKWALTEDGVLMVSGCGKMYDYFYRRSEWGSYKPNIIAVELPEGLSSIGEFAFYDCEYLQRVTVPTSVTSIGGFAFEHCPALTIFGAEGSFAEAFARDNHIPFVIQS